MLYIKTELLSYYQVIQKESVMKKMKIVFTGVLFCLLCCSSPAMAVDVYGFGSYWEKGDIDGTWGAGVGVSLPIIIDNIRLDGRVHYFDSSDVGNDEVKVIPFDLGVQLHLTPDSAFDPYILGGISYNYVDTKHLDLDSKFGGYLGGGVDLELGASFFKRFGELLYRFSDIENMSGDDVDASGVTVNIGLKFHFF